MGKKTINVFQEFEIFKLIKLFRTLKYIYVHLNLILKSSLCVSYFFFFCFTSPQFFPFFPKYEFPYYISKLFQLGLIIKHIFYIR